MSKGTVFLGLLSIVNVGVWAAVTFTSLFQRPPEASFTIKTIERIEPDVRVDLLEELGQDN